MRPSVVGEKYRVYDYDLSLNGPSLKIWYSIIHVLSNINRKIRELLTNILGPIDDSKSSSNETQTCVS